MEIIFKNAGEAWSQEEDTQLNKLYNEDMIDIIEIYYYYILIIYVI
jgi:hypothetical protein